MRRCCRHRLLLASCLVALAGCGGDGGGGTAVDTVVMGVPGSRTGRLLAAGGTTALSVEVRGRDGTPVAGISVLFAAPPFGPGGTFAGAGRAGEGDRLFRARTDVEGRATASFTAGGEPGAYLISAQVEGAPALLTFAVTQGAPAGAPALAAETARRAAEQRFLSRQSALAMPVLHGPVLLEAGSVVEPESTDLDGNPPAPVTVGEPTWLFWLDEEPSVLFAHPTRFILLDAGDAGEGFIDRARVIDHFWWPRITPPGGESRSLLPPSYHFETLADPNPRASLAVRGRAPADACAVLIHGPDGSQAFANEVEDFRRFLIETDRVSADHIFPTGPTLPSTRAHLESQIQRAVDAGCKKVYLLIEAHGAPGYFQLRAAGAQAAPDAPRENVTYDDLALMLRPLQGEVCAVIMACYSGSALPAFQNRGNTGQIATNADARTPPRYSLVGGTDGKGFSFYVRALLKCWRDARADAPPEDGHITLQEAHNWVLAHGGKDESGIYDDWRGLTLIGNPVTAPIKMEETPYTRLPDVDLVKPGDSAQVQIRLPEGVTPNLSFTGTLEISGPPLALIGGSSLLVTFRAGDTVSITGLLEGETTYSLIGRAGDGRVFSATATIRVGSTLAGDPDPVRLLVNQSQPVLIARGGVLARLQTPVTVSLSSQDARIATVAPGGLVFAPGVARLPVAVTAGFQVGSTTVEIKDEQHGVIGSFTVNVEQQVLLNHTLVAPDGTVFEEGTVIRTGRIQGLLIWPPDDGCSAWHLHAEGAGIFIDGKGPIPDPHRSGCGYGPVIQPPNGIGGL